MTVGHHSTTIPSKDKCGAWICGLWSHDIIAASRDKYNEHSFSLSLENRSHSGKTPRNNVLALITCIKSIPVQCFRVMLDFFLWQTFLEQITLYSILYNYTQHIIGILKGC